MRGILSGVVIAPLIKNPTALPPKSHPGVFGIGETKKARAYPLATRSTPGCSFSSQANVELHGE